jgi:hypothetical protein
MYRVFSLVLVVLQAAAPPTTTITTIHHQCLPLPYSNWNGMTSHQLYIQVIISNANSIKILYYDISRLRSLTYSILLDTTFNNKFSTPKTEPSFNSKLLSHNLRLVATFKDQKRETLFVDLLQDYYYHMIMMNIN